MRRNPAGLHLTLMLALTFSTGVIDAVGYLGLDRVFTGNMTGNVVILGMALTGADDLPIVGPIVALVLFMLGAAVSGRTLRHESAGWHLRSTVLFSVVGIVLVAAAVPMLMDADPAEPIKYAVTGALGLAMGLQAGAARHIGVKDVTTVVVTSTIVGLAYDSVFAGTDQGSPVAAPPARDRADRRRCRRRSAPAAGQRRRRDSRGRRHHAADRARRPPRSPGSRPRRSRRVAARLRPARGLLPPAALWPLPK